MNAGGDSSLEAIGFDAHFQARFAALAATEPLIPARIAIAHGESYIAWTARGSCNAVLIGRRIAEWKEAADRPQVGDWVAGIYSESSDSLLIEHLIERRTCLMRLAAGERGVAQVIAANVDVVGIVSAFDAGKAGAGGGAGVRGRRLINEPRLRRYLTTVEQSGAKAVLIVNKSDLDANPTESAEALRLLFAGVPVVVTSATGGFGLDTLAPWLAAGKTLGLIGMSGVGKSTLANALLGRTAQRIGEVRERDARGRHTTTHRELFLMENGALLIDTPGMREFGLLEDETLTTFDDVLEIAAGCRFNDCQHATEPACAIREALKTGALSAERWQSYRKQEEKIRSPGPRGRAAPHGTGTNQPSRRRRR